LSAFTSIPEQTQSLRKKKVLMVSLWFLYGFSGFISFQAFFILFASFSIFLPFHTLQTPPTQQGQQQAKPRSSAQNISKHLET
jgi:hypothetical protein